MRKRLSLLMILGMLFAIPAAASAQTEIKLSSVKVQLWPEYDQPSMLVIYDFKVAESTPLPAKISLRLPADANVIAVAFDDGAGNLINAAFEGPVKGGEWQTLTITVDSLTTYRFEYYEALSANGKTRQFNYVWPGDYAVESFSIGVQEPVDTITLSAEPTLNKTQRNGINYYESKSLGLAAGEQFTLNLQYDKSSNQLTAPSGVQTAPIDQNTEGRISFNSYVPYILGVIGLTLIAGGLVYYFQPGRARGGKKRSRSRPPREQADDGNIHCHQCGTRARPGDRFCRTCGTRLRLDDQ
jgi:hypothetical protein